jgi:N-acetylglucosaminyldiphosphoundecaprenol N-acetyl-beta-D-mannosaminyltransferase
MRYFLRHSPAPLTHYFLGGSEECVRRLQSIVEGENPNLRVAGVRNGYFQRDEESAILEEINRLSPDFIWVGLGTPKQQDWIFRHKGRIARGMVFAVGFAFDVNAGMKRDAPLWMQRLGLTWVFRLASEPGRLVGRYLRFNSLFLYYLWRDGLGRGERT